VNPEQKQPGQEWHDPPSQFSPDWVTVCDGLHPGTTFGMKCQRCGEVQKIKLPVAADFLVAVGKAFVREHRRCKEVTNP